MSPRLTALLLAVVTAQVACGRTGLLDEFPPPASAPPVSPAGPAQVPDAGPAIPRSPALSGLWLVDQPSHALYEATWYAVRPEGDVEVLRVVDWGRHLGKHGVTGSVSAPGGEPSCVFGASWSSQGDRTLVLSGDCSDLAPRWISLSFPEVPTPGSSYLPELEVTGETGWIHDNWDWRFYLCPEHQDENDCLGY